MVTINILDMLVISKKLKVKVLLQGCSYKRDVYSPKIAAYFSEEKYTRRIPLVVTSYRQMENSAQALVEAEQEFVLSYIFQVGKQPEKFNINFAMQYGSLEQEKVLLNEVRVTSDHISVNKISQSELSVVWDGENDKNEKQQTNDSGVKRGAESFASKINRHVFRLMYNLFSKKEIQKDKVFFLSNRRDYMSGNMEFVNEELKGAPISKKVLLKNCSMNQFHPVYFWKAAYHAATSKIILVDDSCNFLDYIDLKKQTSLMQLWHACGAFKTFGYSRLGKSEGPGQTDRNHRFYTYATVSSAEVGKFYAEAFGIPMDNVYPTGVPRTDVFFDKEYKAKMQKKFYEEHPELKGKKILLFAPTFRGWDKESAYYPMEQFAAEKFSDKLGDEYAIILKYHPYIKERYLIPENKRNCIIDLTDSAEINDLLFVSDLVITDYSSVIFEASLLNIPMLFYAYDLEEYISARDFYYEFVNFVPGKIVDSQETLLQAIQENDFEAEKIEEFKKRFFDHLDGKSSARVAKLVLQDLKKEE